MKKVSEKGADELRSEYKRSSSHTPAWVTVSVKRYTGTQVERPETVKGEPKVAFKGVLKRRTLRRKGTGQVEFGRVYTHCGQDLGVGA
jgi:hypothetical protein